jgi:predicted phosphodiesterase
MPQFAAPVRIISDLHLGHPGSRLAGVSQIEGVLDGAGTVIFNGDIVESRWEEERAHAARHLDAARDLCARLGIAPVFINGNHDPAISELNHLDLADGAVFLTHGDVLFHEISPWSSQAPLLASTHESALAEIGGGELDRLEHLLHANKQASARLELFASCVNNVKPGALPLFKRCAWPPWRPLLILRVWAKTPSLAAAFAARHRPRAAFVLIGHTHRAGIWRRGPRTVINTGGFLPFGRQLAADLAGGMLTLRRILRVKNRFVIGPVISRHEAKPLSAE